MMETLLSPPVRPAGYTFQPGKKTTASKKNELRQTLALSAVIVVIVIFASLFANAIGGAAPVKWTAVSDRTFVAYTRVGSITGIAYGGGKFFAFGNAGRAAYSTDGVTWTAALGTTFGGRAIRSIAYGGGKFVAVGKGKAAYWPVGGGDGSDDSSDEGSESNNDAGEYRVTTSALNIRSGPGASNALLGTLRQGDKITVLEINDGWAQFSFQGKTGYTSSNYLQKIPE
jgi:uncharacterized protein YgiM (DUF1202 family)